MEAEYQVNVTGLVRFIIPLTSESLEERGAGVVSINANCDIHILPAEPARSVHVCWESLECACML